MTNPLDHGRFAWERKLPTPPDTIAQDLTKLPLTVEPILSPATLAALRALRLWHWRKVTHNRHEARVQELHGRNMSAKNLNLTADFHLKQVQVLNEFFPELGDTAERDAERTK